MPYKFNYRIPIGTGSESDPVLSALRQRVEIWVSTQLVSLVTALSETLPILSDDEYRELPAHQRAFFLPTSEDPREGVVHRPVPPMLFGNSDDMQREAAGILNEGFDQLRREERNRPIIDNPALRADSTGSGLRFIRQEGVVSGRVSSALSFGNVVGNAAPSRAIMTDTEPEDQ